MNVAFISIDDCKKYTGVSVSIGDDKRGFHREDNNVVADFMSAISYAFGKQAYINFSSSVDEFVNNHKKKYKFFEFESSGITFLVIAPAKVKDKEEFIQYLIDNDIYNVPEGYESCYFIKFFENGYGGFCQNHLFRQYPVIDGRPVCHIKKRDQKILGYIWLELDEKRDSYSYDSSNGWVHHMRNYSDSNSMRYNLECHIKSEFEKLKRYYQENIDNVQSKLNSFLIC